MGTPFIRLLEPTNLTGYDRTKPPAEQPPSIPRTFLDAMAVREEVFVREQKVPLENEMDEDDARSCHWVVYASTNVVVQHEVRDPDTGDVVLPKQSETTSQPIGTLRLVPFPHPPHPRPGGDYWDGKLTNAGEEAAAPGPDGSGVGDGGPKATVEPLTEEEERRLSAPQPFGHDRPTSFHDGKEPYVKLGRLAVLKDFRGRGVSSLLVNTALEWMKEHPAYFNPSVERVGLDTMGPSAAAGDVPTWNGLVCCHAQVQASRVWLRLGFEADELMGEWREEGMPHVGMFQRLAVRDDDPDAARRLP